MNPTPLQPRAATSYQPKPPLRSFVLPPTFCLEAHGQVHVDFSRAGWTRWGWALRAQLGRDVGRPALRGGDAGREFALPTRPTSGEPSHFGVLCKISALVASHRSTQIFPGLCDSFPGCGRGLCSRIRRDDQLVLPPTRYLYLQSSFFDVAGECHTHLWAQMDGIPAEGPLVGGSQGNSIGPVGRRCWSTAPRRRSRCVRTLEHMSQLHAAACARTHPDPNTTLAGEASTES